MAPHSLRLTVDAALWEAFTQGCRDIGLTPTEEITRLLQRRVLDWQAAADYRQWQEAAECPDCPACGNAGGSHLLGCVYGWAQTPADLRLACLEEAQRLAREGA
jgi:hypothetical protein